MKNEKKSGPNPRSYYEKRKKRHPDLAKTAVAQMMLQQMLGSQMPPPQGPQGMMNG